MWYLAATGDLLLTLDAQEDSMPAMSRSNTVSLLRPRLCQANKPERDRQTTPASPDVL